MTMHDVSTILPGTVGNNKTRLTIPNKESPIAMTTPIQSEMLNPHVRSLL